jgi:glucose/arabinose dehydrogenase
MLQGAHYRDPEFSWRFAVAPAAIGFVRGRGLGPRYAGDLIVGASRPTLENGYLFRFKLNEPRRDLRLNDRRLADRVADNTDKFDITESESLLFGRNFGVGTDIQTGPNGNLFVVSLSNGAIYEVFRVRQDAEEEERQDEER